MPIIIIQKMMFYPSVPVLQVPSTVFVVLLANQDTSSTNPPTSQQPSNPLPSNNPPIQPVNSSEKQPINRRTDIRAKMEHLPEHSLQPHHEDEVSEKEEGEEFVPNRAQSAKRSRNSQNANRNVIPNIIHKVMSFMLKKIRSGKIVHTLFQKLLPQARSINPKGLEKCSFDRYYLYLTSIKNKTNNYVNQDTLLIFNQLQDPTFTVYSEPEQHLYIKICHMLVLYFLEQQYDLTILTSKRMKPEKKLAHLQVKRKLLHKLPEIFSSTLLHYTPK